MDDKNNLNLLSTNKKKRRKAMNLEEERSKKEIKIIWIEWPNWKIFEKSLF